jgi:hypothetical protein
MRRKRILPPAAKDRLIDWFSRRLNTASLTSYSSRNNIDPSRIHHVRSSPLRSIAPHRDNLHNAPRLYPSHRHRHFDKRSSTHHRPGANDSLCASRGSEPSQWHKESCSLQISHGSGSGDLPNGYHGPDVCEMQYKDRVTQVRLTSIVLLDEQLGVLNVSLESTYGHAVFV